MKQYSSAEILLLIIVLMGVLLPFEVQLVLNGKKDWLLYLASISALISFLSYRFRNNILSYLSKRKFVFFIFWGMTLLITVMNLLLYFLLLKNE